MNIEQAKLFTKIALHVKGVERLNYAVSPYFFRHNKEHGSVCYIAEACKAGLLDLDEWCDKELALGGAEAFAEYFGITDRESTRLLNPIMGGRSAGKDHMPQAKSILEKYGHAHLLEVEQPATDSFEVIMAKLKAGELEAIA